MNVAHPGTDAAGLTGVRCADRNPEFLRRRRHLCATRFGWPMLIVRWTCVVVAVTVASLASRAVVCGDDGVWVAVGYGGRRMISNDGLNWTITAEWEESGGDNGNNLISAVYAQKQFVVVGGGGGGKTAKGHILVSRDGREWTETFTGNARVLPVTHGKDRFVVGMSGYPSGKLMWSKDAQTWHEGAAIRTRGLTHFRGGAFGNGVFVLVGNSGGSGGRSWAITTTDGEKLISERDDLPGHGTIVFGAGRFLMLTSHKEAALIESTDGANWNPVTVEDGMSFGWLVWTGKEIIAGNRITAYRSTDGADWHQQPMSCRGRVKWSDGTRFIGSSWPGKMSFSADGETWQNSPPLTPNGINQVVYGLPGSGERHSD